MSLLVAISVVLYQILQPFKLLRCAIGRISLSCGVRLDKGTSFCQKNGGEHAVSSKIHEIRSRNIQDTSGVGHMGRRSA
jgi:hypothetical protein